MAMINDHCQYRSYYEGKSKTDQKLKRSYSYSVPVSCNLKL